MSATKLDALQMAIRIEKDSLGMMILESRRRLCALPEQSQLYAFAYGELTEQKRFYEILKRWSE